MDFATMSNEDLATALTDTRTKASTLFAMETPTIEQVNEVEALVATATSIETEQATRAAAVKDATDRFAAAKTAFAVKDENADDAPADDAPADDKEKPKNFSVEDDEDDEEDGEDAEVDADGEDDTENIEAGEADAETEEAEPTVTAAANHTTSQTIKANAAKTVARRNKRPAVKKTADVVITASGDVQGFTMGQRLNGMDEVSKAMQSRAKGFAPWNRASAEVAASQSGGQPVLNKFSTASFTPEFPESLVASRGNDYSAVKAAIKQRTDVITASMFGEREAALVAAGWCAPSENVYSYIADYVVDGISKTPQVKAPRGGLNITTGPVRSSQGTALDDFGFTQTEAQAEAQTVKTCETIDCPDFVDHRLDAIGYCYKIPLLTQKAYPELITDALKFAGVLWAHKKNARVLADKVALSDVRTFEGYGPSVTDALEALSILALKERRKWNIGVNATLTVEAPEWAREVFRADMSRRAGLALDDVATDQKIAAHFAARKLDVQYVSDWQELAGTNIILPGTFDVLVYPSGTFVEAIEDVINLSTVYDAASLSINEYTGVFFEQGYLLAKVGYSSSKITIPVNTAGETGALTLTGFGDAIEAGSF